MNCCPSSLDFPCLLKNGTAHEAGKPDRAGETNLLTVLHSIWRIAGHKSHDAFVIVIAHDGFKLRWSNVIAKSKIILLLVFGDDGKILVDAFISKRLWI